MSSDADPTPGFLDYSGISSGGFRVSSNNRSIPFWGDSPEVWDTVIFDGLPLPGTCVVGGKAYEVKTDHKKPPGTHGASVTTLGRHPAEPEFKLTLWMPEHLRNFAAIMDSFIPRSGKAVGRAVPVIHPNLSLYKIKAVKLETASFLMEREPQVYEVTLKCVEASLKNGKVATKPTDDSSIISRGPGAVAREAARRTAAADPGSTNGNGPRGSSGSY